MPRLALYHNILDSAVAVPVGGLIVFEIVYNKLAFYRAGLFGFCAYVPCFVITLHNVFFRFTVDEDYRYIFSLCLAHHGFGGRAVNRVDYKRGNAFCYKCIYLFVLRRLLVLRVHDFKLDALFVGFLLHLVSYARHERIVKFVNANADGNVRCLRFAFSALPIRRPRGRGACFRRRI